MSSPFAGTSRTAESAKMQVPPVVSAVPYGATVPSIFAGVDLFCVPVESADNVAQCLAVDITHHLKRSSIRSVSHAVDWYYARMFKLSGDFTFTTFDTNGDGKTDKTLIGAKNVELASEQEFAARTR